VATPLGDGWVDLYRPRLPIALLVLTHGAGGGVRSPDLLAVRDAAVAARVAVALVTQAYRVAGRSTPPKAGPQDASWMPLVEAVRRRRGLGRLPLIVGGRSNGARVACRSAQAVRAAGVVALAFPLHPPGRPELTRIAELDATGVPTLVVQGARDPFGMPPGAPGREVHVVPQADHALKRGASEFAAEVTRFVTALASAAR
jgi:predicted alpha/beta-hydrolase family hydrolase